MSGRSGRLTAAQKRAANAAATRAILERRKQEAEVSEWGAELNVEIARLNEEEDTDGSDARASARQHYRRAAESGWVTSLELVAAGITNPRQAIADLRRAGVDIDERVVRMYMAWRLREQLPQQRDAECLGSDE